MRRSVSGETGDFSVASINGTGTEGSDLTERELQQRLEAVAVPEFTELEAEYMATGAISYHRFDGGIDPDVDIRRLRRKLVGFDSHEFEIRRNKSYVLEEIPYRVPTSEQALRKQRLGHPAAGAPIRGVTGKGKNSGAVRGYAVERLLGYVLDGWMVDPDPGWYDVWIPPRYREWGDEYDRVRPETLEIPVEMLLREISLSIDDNEDLAASTPLSWNDPSDYIGPLSSTEAKKVHDILEGDVSVGSDGNVFDRLDQRPRTQTIWDGVPWEPVDPARYIEIKSCLQQYESGSPGRFTILKRNHDRLRKTHQWDPAGRGEYRFVVVSPVESRGDSETEVTITRNTVTVSPHVLEEVLSERGLWREEQHETLGTITVASISWRKLLRALSISVEKFLAGYPCIPFPSDDSPQGKQVRGGFADRRSKMLAKESRKRFAWAVLEGEYNGDLLRFAQRSDASLLEPVTTVY